MAVVSVHHLAYFSITYQLSILRDISAKITKKARDIALDKLEVYSKWFCNIIMQVEKQNAIVVLPIENMSPRYRDEAR